MIEYLDLGIAGVLAVALFFFLRHLVGQMRQDRVFMEDRLTNVISGYNDAIKAFTEAAVELITWLKARNGKPKE